MELPEVDIKYIERFRFKVLDLGPNDCWPWLGAKRKDGYGELQIVHKKVLAHRMAYLVENGSLDDQIKVCHTCDNRICCNPRHLFLGSQLDNILDRCAKGRTAIPAGSKNNNASTFEAKVLEIKRLLAEGLAHKTIADQCGVGVNVVRNVSCGRGWTHV